MDKDTMKIVPGGAANEARQALKSIGHILDAAGSSYAKVIKSTVMLNDINDFAAVNEVYKECKLYLIKNILILNIIFSFQEGLSR